MIKAILRIIFPPHCKLPVITAAILTKLALPCSAASHTQSFPEAALFHGTTAAGHPYIKGGINVDEQRALERLAESYNLKLVFISRLGNLVTPTSLIIGDNKSGQVELVRLRAPWFYIRLPPGGYTILTQFNRQLVLVRNVYLHEDRRKTYFVRGE
jgi:hypothetical protein